MEYAELIGSFYSRSPSPTLSLSPGSSRTPSPSVPLLNVYHSLRQIFQDIRSMVPEEGQPWTNRDRGVLVDFLSHLAQDLNEEQTEPDYEWDHFTMDLANLLKGQAPTMDDDWKSRILSALRDLSIYGEGDSFKVYSRFLVLSFRLFSGEQEDFVDWIQVNINELVGRGTSQEILSSVVALALVPTTADPSIVIEDCKTKVLRWLSVDGIQTDVVLEILLAYVQRVSDHLALSGHDDYMTLFDPFCHEAVDQHVRLVPIFQLASIMLNKSGRSNDIMVREFLQPIRNKFSIVKSAVFIENISVAMRWGQPVYCDAKKAATQICQLAWLLVGESDSGIAIREWAGLCVIISEISALSFYNDLKKFDFLNTVWVELVAPNLGDEKLNLSVRAFKRWGEAMPAYPFEGEEYLTRLLNAYDIKLSDSNQKECDDLVDYYHTACVRRSLSQEYLLRFYRNQFALDSAWAPSIIGAIKRMFSQNKIKQAEACLTLLSEVLDDRWSYHQELVRAVKNLHALHLLMNWYQLISPRRILLPEACEGVFYNKLKEFVDSRSLSACAFVWNNLSAYTRWEEIPAAQRTLLQASMGVVAQNRIIIHISHHFLDSLSTIDLFSRKEKLHLLMGSFELHDFVEPCVNYLEDNQGLSLQESIEEFFDGLLHKCEELATLLGGDPVIPKMQICCNALLTLVGWEQRGYEGEKEVDLSELMICIAKMLQKAIPRATEGKKIAIEHIQTSFVSIVSNKWNRMEDKYASMKTPMYTLGQRGGIVLLPVKDNQLESVIILAKF